MILCQVQPDAPDPLSPVTMTRGKGLSHRGDPSLDPRCTCGFTSESLLCLPTESRFLEGGPGPACPAPAPPHAWGISSAHNPTFSITSMLFTSGRGTQDQDTSSHSPASAPVFVGEPGTPGGGAQPRRALTQSPSSGRCGSLAGSRKGWPALIPLPLRCPGNRPRGDSGKCKSESAAQGRGDLPGRAELAGRPGDTAPRAGAHSSVTATTPPWLC